MTIPGPQLLYCNDDGIVPNSKLPLLLYKDVFSQRQAQGAAWLEARFAANGWTNAWRWGIYPFHHYHSNTHEVLGCYSGDALLQLGGENGQELPVEAGDILVIPAGVAHKCLSHSSYFSVVGAYPNNLMPDLMRGTAGERPAADERIAQVKLPQTDPFAGEAAGLPCIWYKN